MTTVVDLQQCRWVLADVKLTDLQRQRLEAVLAQGGMPSLFWPSVVKVVQGLCAEAVVAREVGEGGP